MKHIEIIMTIEEDFNISFTAADLPYLTSKSVIEKKLSELGV
jgi:acyl carrier protein